jgi:hypothetical protein
MEQTIQNADGKQVALRLPAKLYTAIKEAGEAERRKPAALMRIFLEDAIKGRAGASRAA